MALAKKESTMVPPLLALTGQLQPMRWKKRPAEGQDPVEDGEILSIPSSGDIPQLKKSKTTDRSSLLAVKFDTLTSSIHQLIQVMTLPAPVAGPPAEPSGGKKGKAVKKVCYEESDTLKRTVRKTVAQITQVILTTSYHLRWR